MLSTAVCDLTTDHLNLFFKSPPPFLFLFHIFIHTNSLSASNLSRAKIFQSVFLSPFSCFVVKTKTKHAFPLNTASVSDRSTRRSTGQLAELQFDTPPVRMIRLLLLIRMPPLL